MFLGELWEKLKQLPYKLYNYFGAILVHLKVGFDLFQLGLFLSCHMSQTALCETSTHTEEEVPLSKMKVRLMGCWRWVGGWVGEWWWRGWGASAWRPVHTLRFVVVTSLKNTAYENTSWGFTVSAEAGLRSVRSVGLPQSHIQYKKKAKYTQALD